MNKKIDEIISTLIAGGIFILLMIVLYLAYYAILALLVIWVVKGICGVSLSHAFLQVLIGLMIIKAIITPITVNRSK